MKNHALAFELHINTNYTSVTLIPLKYGMLYILQFFIIPIILFYHIHVGAGAHDAFSPSLLLLSSTSGKLQSNAFNLLTPQRPIFSWSPV